MPKRILKKKIERIVLSILKHPEAHLYSYGLKAEKIAEEVMKVLDNKEQFRYIVAVTKGEERCC